MAHYLVRTLLRLDGQLFQPGSMLAMEPERAKELVNGSVITPVSAPEAASGQPVPTDDPVVAAMNRLDPNQPGHWTRDGKPRLEVLSQLAGRAVRAAQRDRLWRTRESMP